MPRRVSRIAARIGPLVVTALLVAGGVTGALGQDDAAKRLAACAAGLGCAGLAASPFEARLLLGHADEAAARAQFESRYGAAGTAGGASAVPGSSAAGVAERLSACAAGLGCEKAGVTPVEARLILGHADEAAALAAHRARHGRPAAPAQARGGPARTQARRLWACAAGLGCTGTTQAEARILLGHASTAEAREAYEDRYAPPEAPGTPDQQSQKVARASANDPDPVVRPLPGAAAGAAGDRSATSEAQGASGAAAGRPLRDRPPRGAAQQPRTAGTRPPGTGPEHAPLRGSEPRPAAPGASGGLPLIETAVARPVKLLVPQRRIPNVEAALRRGTNLVDVVLRGPDTLRADVVETWWRPDGSAAYWFNAPPRPGTYDVVLANDRTGSRKGRAVARLAVAPNPDLRIIAPREVAACADFSFLYAVAGDGVFELVGPGGARIGHPLYPPRQARQMTATAPDRPGDITLRYVVERRFGESLDRRKVTLAEAPVSIVPGACGEAEKAAGTVAPADDDATPRRSDARLEIPERVVRGERFTVRSSGAEGRFAIGVAERRDGRWRHKLRTPLGPDGVALFAFWPPGDYRVTLYEVLPPMGVRLKAEERILAVEPAADGLDPVAATEGIALALPGDVTTGEPMAWRIDHPDPLLTARWVDEPSSRAGRDDPRCRTIRSGKAASGTGPALRRKPLSVGTDPGRRHVALVHDDLPDRPLLVCSVDVRLPFAIAERRAAMDITVSDIMVADDTGWVAVTPSDSDYRVTIEEAASDEARRGEAVPLRRMPAEAIRAMGEAGAFARPLSVPDPPGSYDLVVRHAHTGSRVIARAPLTVEPPMDVAALRETLRWRVPEDLAPGSVVEVTFTPFVEGLRLDIEGEDWRYHTGNNPPAERRRDGQGGVVRVDLPSRPGRFRLTLYHPAFEPRAVIRQTVIRSRFGATSHAALEPAETTVEACETLPVRWTAWPGFELALVDPARRNAEYDSLPVAGAANPARLLAPPRPGRYEVRLVNRNVVTGVPITVTPARDPAKCQEHGTLREDRRLAAQERLGREGS